MRLSRAMVIGAVVCAALTHQVFAQQNFTFTLFERYLDSLRRQVGIPGLSVAVVGERAILWERGLGLQDIEGSIAASPDTTYPILDLNQTFASTLALQCVDRADLSLTDDVRYWTETVPAGTTVGELLSHVGPDATPGFHYAPGRFVALTPALEDCGDRAYSRLLTERILDRMAMFDSVPGRDLGDPATPARTLFDSVQLDRFDHALSRVATPYKVDRSGKAARSEYLVDGVDAASGIISTVRDLARYDVALSSGALVHPETLALAWTNARTVGDTAVPTGLGWFVQNYRGEQIVWHFGLAHDAYSSLIVKVPRRNLTFIVLANSDGLSASFPLSRGDVTASVFAQLFLRTFVS